MNNNSNLNKEALIIVLTLLLAEGSKQVLLPVTWFVEPQTFSSKQNNIIMKSIQPIKISSIAIILLLFVSTGCYYDKVLPIEPEGDISYAQEVQPFFDLKCASCHPDDSQPNLQPDMSYNSLVSGGYIDTANPSNSKLYVKISVGGSMEPFATDTERAITLKWIEQGAKNN